MTFLLSFFRGNFDFSSILMASRRSGALFTPLSQLLKAQFHVLINFQPLCFGFLSEWKCKQSFVSKIWRLLTNRFQKNFLLVFLLQLLQVYDQYLRNVPNYWKIDYNLTIVLTSRVIDNTLLLVKGLWLPILANNLQQCSAV